jgi:hypothetical protein
MEPVTRLTNSLVVLGLASAAVYGLGLALRYPLAAGIALPRHTWAQLVGGATIPALLLHSGLFVAVILFYVAAMRLALRAAAPAVDAGRAPAPVIVVIIGGWLLASTVLMAVAPGGESHDVFDYLFRGSMLVETGASPLAVPPERFADLPFYAYISWPRHVDTYGPLWEYASGATAAAAKAALSAAGQWYTGPGQCPDAPASCRVLLVTVLSYRIFAVAMAGVCGWLIYLLVRRDDSRHAPAALLAWLWNPLLLVASAVGAHNDMVMLVVVLASFYALQRRRWLGSLLLLLLACHVKLTALTLAPLYAFWFVRQLGWRRAATVAVTAGAIGLALSWLLYAPLGGWATLPRMLEERQRYVALSFHHVFYRLLLEQGVERELMWQLTVRWPTLVYLAGAVVLAATMVWRRRAGSEGVQLFWRAATAGNLYYLLVGSFWFQPWYVLWVLAPAALQPAGRFTRSVLPWLCLGALCSNVVADFLPQLEGPPFTRTLRTGLVVLVTWAPAAVAALLAYRREWKGGTHGRARQLAVPWIDS